MWFVFRALPKNEPPLPLFYERNEQKVLTLVVTTIKASCMYIQEAFEVFIVANKFATTICSNDFFYFSACLKSYKKG
jgi:hypothetical protein